jgi:hypothetical protein
MRDGRRVDPHGRRAPDSGEEDDAAHGPHGEDHDAGGIEPFTSRPVSVRLPDGPVNALSELRDGRVRGFGGTRIADLSAARKSLSIVISDAIYAQPGWIADWRTDGGGAAVAGA